MKLPAVARVVVDGAKIGDYPVSGSHPLGRFKATFFLALGYSAADWEVLAADLRSDATDNDAVAGVLREYGEKYEVRGRIGGAAGKGAILVAVRIVVHGEDFPRFVRAFPGARS